MNPFAKPFLPSSSLNVTAKPFIPLSKPKDRKRKLEVYFRNSGDVFIDLENTLHVAKKLKKRSCTMRIIARAKAPRVQSKIASCSDNLSPKKCKDLRKLYEVRSNGFNKLRHSSKQPRGTDRLKFNDWIKGLDKTYQKEYNIRYIKDAYVQARRMVGCNRLYCRRYSANYFLLDLANVSSGILNIHTNYGYKPKDASMFMSSCHFPSVKFLISKYLTEIFELYWFIPYKEKRRVFDRLRTLLLISFEAINNRLSNQSPKERQTKTYIRFSYKQTVIYLGFYVKCSACEQPCAAIKSLNRSFCHQHFSSSFLPSNVVHNIKGDSCNVTKRPKIFPNRRFKMNVSLRTGEIFIKDVKRLDSRIYKASFTYEWTKPNKKQATRIFRRSLRSKRCTDNYRQISHYKNFHYGFHNSNNGVAIKTKELMLSCFTRSVTEIMDGLCSDRLFNIIPKGWKNLLYIYKELRLIGDNMLDYETSIKRFMNKVRNNWKQAEKEARKRESSLGTVFSIKDVLKSLKELRSNIHRTVVDGTDRTVNYSRLAKAWNMRSAGYKDWDELHDLDNSEFWQWEYESLSDPHFIELLMSQFNIFNWTEDHVYVRILAICSINDKSKDDYDLIRYINTVSPDKWSLKYVKQIIYNYDPVIDLSIVTPVEDTKGLEIFTNVEWIMDKCSPIEKADLKRIQEERAALITNFWNKFEMETGDEMMTVIQNHPIFEGKHTMAVYQQFRETVNINNNRDSDWEQIKIIDNIPPAHWPDAIFDFINLH